METRSEVLLLLLLAVSMVTTLHTYVSHLQNIRQTQCLIDWQTYSSKLKWLIIYSITLTSDCGLRPVGPWEAGLERRCRIVVQGRSCVDIHGPMESAPAVCGNLLHGRTDARTSAEVDFVRINNFLLDEFSNQLWYVDEHTGDTNGYYFWQIHHSSHGFWQWWMSELNSFAQWLLFMVQWHALLSTRNSQTVIGRLSRFGTVSKRPRWKLYLCYLSTALSRKLVV